MQKRSPVQNKKSAWAVRLDYIYQMIKPKMKGVILFTGKFGSTRQYADWIKEATELPVFDLRKEKPDLSKYDFFILGSSIFIYKPTIRKWLKRRWPEIKGKPVLLFTVSGAEPGSPELQKWVEDNLGREIIDTITYVPLRGRLKIEELPWYIRFMLKLGANKEEDPEVKKRMVEGFDYMDQSAIQPILEWARSVQKKPAKLV